VSAAAKRIPRGLLRVADALVSITEAPEVHRAA
jgi:hypothetical protein